MAVSRLQAAELRRAWRLAQGAVEIATPEAQIRVQLDSGLRPEVDVAAEPMHESPSRQLVAEMMILAGEVIGDLGKCAAWQL